MKCKVKIENAYSDGHESEHTVELDEPTGLNLDKWFDRIVYEYTGDGHGADNDLGSCYTATIIESNDPELVGKSYEWND